MLLRAVVMGVTAVSRVVVLPACASNDSIASLEPMDVGPENTEVDASSAIALSPLCS